MPAKTVCGIPADKIMGYACLTGLVVSWVAQSEVAQYVQTSAAYNKPYFIVWCNHGGMALVLPCQELWQRYKRRRRRAAQAAAALTAPPGMGSPCQRPSENGGGGGMAEALLLPPQGDDADAAASGCSNEELPWTRSALLQDLRYMHGPAGFSAGWLARQSLRLAGVYTVGDWVWYIGLPHTSVTAGTCIFNSSCVFTYAFSVGMLGMAVTRMRVAAVGVALAGVAVLAMAPGTNNASNSSNAHGGSGGDVDPGSTNGGSSQLVGNLFVLGAAVAYALYTVLSEKHVFRGSSCPVLANALCGTIGVVNTLALWPFIPALGAIPVGAAPWSDWIAEPFAAPDGTQLAFVLTNMLLALLFNLFFMLSISLTSPLVASVACMVSIPLSGLCDSLLWGDSFPPLAYAGSALVVGGFALLTWADLHDAAAADKKAAVAPSSSPPALLPYAVAGGGAAGGGGGGGGGSRQSSFASDVGAGGRPLSLAKQAPFQPLDGGLKPL